MPNGRARPTLLILAGPNGSGKSTFYRNFLQPLYPSLVNADDIAKTLVNSTPSVDERLAANLAAARLATEEREKLIQQGVTFAFETVFSRTSYWIEFIFRALAARYRVEIFFLCTERPDLNVARVETRVLAGGHPVLADKVITRYFGSIQTAVLAKSLVDEFWLYDNTADGKSPLLVGRFVEGKPIDIPATIPQWAIPFFIPVPLAQ